MVAADKPSFSIVIPSIFISNTDGNNLKKAVEVKLYINSKG